MAILCRRLRHRTVVIEVQPTYRVIDYEALPRD